MITGCTSDSVIESSKKMYENTIKQVKSKGKKLDNSIKSVYYGDGKSNIQPMFEPKMTNRWLVKFPKKSNIPEWIGKSVVLPTYPFNPGDKLYVVLYDPILPSTTNSLLKFIENQKPFKLKLDVLDPLGSCVGKWIFKDCLITSIDWSTLDYANNEPMLIHLTISYNKIKYKEK